MANIIERIQEYQRDAPVNIEDLIRSLDIVLDKKANLDEEIAGQIEKTATGTYKISANKNDHYYRQRFTMAHELAHYLLHRSLIGDGVDDSKAYRSTNAGEFYNMKITRRHETQANQFAAYLLMPDNLLEQYYQEFGGDITELSKKFQVSKKAMEIRLSAMSHAPVAAQG